MAMAIAFSSSVSFVPHQSPLFHPNSSSLVPNYHFHHSFPCALMAARVAPSNFALSSTTNNHCQLAADDSVEEDDDDDDSMGNDLEINNRREGEEGKGKMVEESTQTLLYSFTPLPFLLFAALPGGISITIQTYISHFY